MKKYTHFLASEIENSLPEKALFHVIPVAYEYSVSYGTGTKLGPLKILQASEQLELFDAYTSTIPANMGIHTTKAIIESKPKKMLNALLKATKKSLKHNALPVILGGEHSISLGAFRALKEENIDFGIIHIDAHADLRDSYEGSKYSHASVMARALELDIPIVQFGTRAYCLEEKEVREHNKITFYDGHCFADSTSPLPKNTAIQDLLPKDFPKKIYISFDVDGLDPSVIPHTGTPVSGGLGWYQALELLKICLEGRELIAFDVVELAPTKNSQLSDFAAANLVYKIMGLYLNSIK